MAVDASSFPVDLAETDQGFLLRATLPGVGPEDVQITIHGETLTIRAASKTREERKEENWLIREQRSGQYQRLVSLPAPVDPDQAEATFKDGILELTLPKAGQARPREVRVIEVGRVSGNRGAPQAMGANGASGTASTASVSPPTAPETPADKSPVTQASEESMDASDPPSWTRERT